METSELGYVESLPNSSCAEPGLPNSSCAEQDTTTKAAVVIPGVSTESPIGGVGEIYYLIKDSETGEYYAVPIDQNGDGNTTTEASCVIATEESLSTVVSAPAVSTESGEAVTLSANDIATGFAIESNSDVTFTMASSDAFTNHASNGSLSVITDDRVAMGSGYGSPSAPVTRDDNPLIMVQSSQCMRSNQDPPGRVHSTSQPNNATSAGNLLDFLSKGGIDPQGSQETLSEDKSEVDASLPCIAPTLQQETLSLREASTDEESLTDIDGLYDNLKKLGLVNSPQKPSPGVKFAGKPYHAKESHLGVPSVLEQNPDDVVSSSSGKGFGKGRLQTLDCERKSIGTTRPCEGSESRDNQEVFHGNRGDVPRQTDGGQDDAENEHANHIEIHLLPKEKTKDKTESSVPRLMLTKASFKKFSPPRNFGQISFGTFLINAFFRDFVPYVCIAELLQTSVIPLGAAKLKRLLKRQKLNVVGALQAELNYLKNVRVVDCRTKCADMLASSDLQILAKYLLEQGFTNKELKQISKHTPNIKIHQHLTSDESTAMSSSTSEEDTTVVKNTRDGMLSDGVRSSPIDDCTQTMVLPAGVTVHLPDTSYLDDIKSLDEQDDFLERPRRKPGSVHPKPGANFGRVHCSCCRHKDLPDNLVWKPKQKNCSKTSNTTVDSRCRAQGKPVLKSDKLLKPGKYRVMFDVQPLLSQLKSQGINTSNRLQLSIGPPDNCSGGESTSEQLCTPSSTSATVVQAIDHVSQAYQKEHEQQAHGDTPTPRPDLHVQSNPPVDILQAAMKETFGSTSVISNSSCSFTPDADPGNNITSAILNSAQEMYEPDLSEDNAANMEVDIPGGNKTGASQDGTSSHPEKSPETMNDESCDRVDHYSHKAALAPSEMKGKLGCLQSTDKVVVLENLTESLPFLRMTDKHESSSSPALSSFEHTKRTICGAGEGEQPGCGSPITRQDSPGKAVLSSKSSTIQQDISSNASFDLSPLPLDKAVACDQSLTTENPILQRSTDSNAKTKCSTPEKKSKDSDTELNTPKCSPLLDRSKGGEPSSVSAERSKTISKLWDRIVTLEQEGCPDCSLHVLAEAAEAVNEEKTTTGKKNMETNNSASACTEDHAYTLHRPVMTLDRLESILRKYMPKYVRRVGDQIEVSVVFLRDSIRKTGIADWTAEEVPKLRYFANVFGRMVMREYRAGNIKLLPPETPDNKRMHKKSSEMQGDQASSASPGSSNSGLRKPGHRAHKIASNHGSQTTVVGTHAKANLQPLCLSENPGAATNPGTQGEEAMDCVHKPKSDRLASADNTDNVNRNSKEDTVTQRQSIDSLKRDNQQCLAIDMRGVLHEEGFRGSEKFVTSGEISERQPKDNSQELCNNQQRARLPRKKKSEMLISPYQKKSKRHLPVRSVKRSANPLEIPVSSHDSCLAESCENKQFGMVAEHDNVIHTSRSACYSESVEPEILQSIVNAGNTEWLDFTGPTEGSEDGEIFFKRSPKTRLEESDEDTISIESQESQTVGRSQNRCSSEVSRLSVSDSSRRDNINVTSSTGVTETGLNNTAFAQDEDSPDICEYRPVQRKPVRCDNVSSMSTAELVAQVDNSSPGQNAVGDANASDSASHSMYESGGDMIVDHSSCAVIICSNKRKPVKGLTPGARKSRRHSKDSVRTISSLNENDRKESENPRRCMEHESPSRNISGSETMREECAIKKLLTPPSSEREPGVNISVQDVARPCQTLTVSSQSEKQAVEVSEKDRQCPVDDRHGPGHDSFTSLRTSQMKITDFMRFSSRKPATNEQSVSSTVDGEIDWKIDSQKSSEASSLASTAGTVTQSVINTKSRPSHSVTTVLKSRATSSAISTPKSVGRMANLESWATGGPTKSRSISNHMCTASASNVSKIVPVPSGAAKSLEQPSLYVSTKLRSRSLAATIDSIMKSTPLSAVVRQRRTQSSGAIQARSGLPSSYSAESNEWLPRAGTPTTSIRASPRNNPDIPLVPLSSTKPRTYRKRTSSGSTKPSNILPSTGTTDPTIVVTPTTDGGKEPSCGTTGLKKKQSPSGITNPREEQSPTSVTNPEITVTPSDKTNPCKKPSPACATKPKKRKLSSDATKNRKTPSQSGASKTGKLPSSSCVNKPGKTPSFCATKTEKTTSRVIKTGKRPSCANKTGKTPSSANKTGKTSSGVTKTGKTPPSAAKTVKTPSSGATKTEKTPSSAIKTGKTPSSANKTGKTPSSVGATKTRKTPSSGATKTEKIPSGAIKTGKTPSSANKTGKTPSVGATKTGKTPSAATKTGKTPSSGATKARKTPSSSAGAIRTQKITSQSGATKPRSKQCNPRSRYSSIGMTVLSHTPCVKASPPSTTNAKITPVTSKLSKKPSLPGTTKSRKKSPSFDDAKCRKGQMLSVASKPRGRPPKKRPVPSLNKKPSSTISTSKTLTSKTSLAKSSIRALKCKRRVTTITRRKQSSSARNDSVKEPSQSVLVIGQLDASNNQSNDSGTSNTVFCPVADCTNNPSLTCRVNIKYSPILQETLRKSKDCTIEMEESTHSVSSTKNSVIQPTCTKRRKLSY